jgi:hypothetical protein
MADPSMPSGEISRRGEALYDERIGPLVETEENIGKEIVIDVETGNYAIIDESGDGGGLAARDSLLQKNPGAVLYGMRIGYDVAYALGGSLERRSTRP